MREISLISLGEYSLLFIYNANGSAVEIRLTQSQINYLEEKIAFNKSQAKLAKKAGN